MAVPQPRRTEREERREVARIARREGPAYQAYQVLLFGFTIAPIVAAWLCGIIANLLLIPAHYDIALRDFGLALGALALARLGRPFEGRES